MKKLLPITTVVLICVLSLTAVRDSIAISPLQSSLATEVFNPKFVYSEKGGRTYCGALKSSAWLEIPPRFTEDGGAEVHCDLNPRDASFGSINSTYLSRALNNKGYLVGIYPKVKLSTPIALTIELDTALTRRLCDRCLTARFYDSEIRGWRDLKSVFDKKTSRVTVSVDAHLGASGYPAFSDRVLIALFVETPRTRSTPKAP